MNEQEAVDLGAIVRRARMSRGWTIRDLAEQAQVSPHTANSVELGRTVRKGNLRAVLDALGVKPLAATEVDADPDVDLVLDIVRKWLEAVSPEDRPARVRDLTRFIVLGA